MLDVARKFQLKHYDVSGVLARGGMGVIYRAYDPHLDREVAIKVLPEEVTGSIRLERFLREIRIAKNLTHPNIVPVHDAGEDQGLLFFVMPLIDGETLAERLQREGVIPPRAAVNLACDVLSALSHAHAHGVVHRDIKPANILIVDDRAIVADFGLALAVEASADDRITQSGTSVGTPSYMSPEQAAGQPIDARSDLYSVGCVLYEMLSGAPPFASSTVVSTLRKHLTETPKKLTPSQPHVPVELDDEVLRLLEKDPASRPSSAKLVASALSASMSAEEWETETATRTRLPASSPQLRRRSRIRWLAGTGLVTGALAAALAWNQTDPALRSTGETLAPASSVVVVLPLENLSGDETLDPIGLGTAHALTSNLSALPGITMISRSASRDLEATDVAELVKSLGVEFVVQGSILKASDRLQVNVNLVRGDHSIAWGGSFEGTEASLFDLQRRLSHALVVALRLDISPESRRRIDELPTMDRDAYAEYTQARAFLERRDVRENVGTAAGLLESAIERDSSFALAHAGLAEAYWLRYELSRELSWTERARAAAARAKELDPEHPDVHYGVAWIDFQTGRYEEALAGLDRVLTLKPAHDEALQLKGRIFAKWGRLDAAADAFRRAIYVRPGYWGHHRELGIMFLRAGRLAEARDAFRRVTELQPDLSWGYQMLGTAHHMDGQIDAAIDQYRRAVELGNSPAALSNLGVIYYRRKSFTQARDFFARSLELEDDAVGRRNLGDALRRLGREDEARDEYRNAIELVRASLAVRPDDAEMLSIWGLCAAKLGDDPQALRHGSAAERIAPSNPDVLHRLAVVHVLGGRPAEALSTLRRAMSFGLSPAEVTRDDDFEALHTHAGFQSLLVEHSPSPTTQ